MNKKTIRIVLIAYFIFGIFQLLNLYLGKSSFFTTTFIYSLLISACIILYSKFPTLKNIFLSLTVFFISLFLGEVFIRFIHKYPLTYSEQNDSGYSSNYLSQPLCNFQRLFQNKYHKDLLTLECRPYEKRDISSVPADGIIRPSETYNILGFRGPLPGGKKKIVACFGDSFTEGACATADSCYPAQLSTLLIHYGRPHDVINAGVSGNDPFYDLQMLKKLSSGYKINTAVFLVNSTDLSDIIERGGNERFVSPTNLRLKPTPWWERIYAVSFIFRLYVHTVLKLNYQFKNEKQEIEEKQNAAKTLATLFNEQIIPYCTTRHINVVIAQHPLNWEMQDTTNYVFFKSQLQQLKGVSYVNTYDSIKAENAKQPLYYKKDLHFSHVGYRIIAKEIYEQATASKAL